MTTSARPIEDVDGCQDGGRHPRPLLFLAAVGGAGVTLEAISDDDGIVRTTVTSGSLASAVQITATVDANGDGVSEVVNQFTPVNIVGGPPSADRFSLAAEFVDIAAG